MRTETKRELLHEAAMLASTLALVWLGIAMTRTYQATGDLLPLLAGPPLVLLGLLFVVETPGRWRRRAKVEVGVGFEGTQM